MNPHDNNKIVFSSDNYQEATFWLAEDEYIKVGRLLYEEAY
jgi:hypothetical protein